MGDIDQAKLFQTISLAVADATRDVLEGELRAKFAELEAENRASNLRELKLAVENEELEAKLNAFVWGENNPSEYVNALEEAQAKHTALVDGLRREVYGWEDGDCDHGCADYFAGQILALLDSINNPDSDSKVSTLIEQEPAPSPPAADDGSQAADGAGS